MSNTIKSEPPKEATASETAKNVSSNAAPTLPPMKNDPNIKYSDDDLESEDVDDEEEALLVALEKEKEKEDAEEAAHPHEQPKSVTSAPRILQDALKKGLVTASDSEEEEEKKEQEKKAASASPEKLAAAKGKSAIQEEKKGDDEHTEPHYHARVSATCHVYPLYWNTFSQMNSPLCSYRKTNSTFFCPGLQNTQILLLRTFKSCRQA